MEKARALKSIHCFLEEGMGVAARRGQGPRMDTELNPRATVVARIFFSMMLWREGHGIPFLGCVKSSRATRLPYRP